MYRMIRTLALALLLSLAPQTPHPPPSYTAADAAKHVGETVTACGQVVSARYARAFNGSPTFLNLDHRRPKQSLTIVVWRADMRHLRGKRICATGKVQLYRGVLQIPIRDLSKLTAPGN